MFAALRAGGRIVLEGSHTSAARQLRVVELEHVKVPLGEPQRSGQGVSHDHRHR